MSDVPTLYERNAAFADGFDLADLPIRPNLSTVILSCVDARVEPAAYASIEPGDAFVLRNTGARVTEAVKTEIALLWALMTMASGGTEPSLELAIVHHSQCGMERFVAPEVAAQLTERFGTRSVVDTYAIGDPLQSIHEDVERLRGDPTVPRALAVSGHMYDLATGRLSEVVPTQTLG